MSDERPVESETGSNSYVIKQVSSTEHEWVPYSAPPSQLSGRPVSHPTTYNVFREPQLIGRPVSHPTTYNVFREPQLIGRPVSHPTTYNVFREPQLIGRPVSSPATHNVFRDHQEENDGEFTIMTEVLDDDRVGVYQRNNYHIKSSSLPPRKVLPMPRVYTGMQQRAFMQHVNSFQNGRIKKSYIDEREEEEDGDNEENNPEMALMFEKNGPVILACFVRLMLIAHNVLTVWRVTDSYQDNMYWLLVIANFLLIIEGMIVIIRRAGLEYSWWTPCFLIYLASTIPAIWLLQLNQYDRFKNPEKWTTAITSIVMTTTTGVPVTNVTDVMSQNTTLVTALSNMTTIPTNTTLITTQAPDEPVFGTLDNDVWVIIVEESLVYLLVFSRWLLPRGEVSRDFLADLLLEFLAIASDIMELLAVFDEEEVRGNLKLTYVIMAVWSASFIQFIPIFMQKKRFRRARSPNVAFLTRHCGDKFIEVVVTCMSIFLQDLPFLVVRLYIIIEVNLITYSLIFFLLKNIVTLLLLFYRLGILCYRLPHCKGKPA